MIKYFAILIHLLAAFVISLFFNQNVTVNIDVPSEVQAGEEFLITLTVSKGTLESFSRFQQELPYGLKASRVSTANTDFSFEDQRVRLIWLKLPANPEITVVYRIKVDERLKGSFSLNAEFAYIEGNERKSISVIGPDNINIIPNPNMAENEIVDIKDFEKLFLADLEIEKRAAQLECTRRPPIQSGREIIIELFINKGTIDRFAKIEEFVPDGFIAGELDSKDGIFSFENQKVKILWMNLPEEQKFTVRYRLFPQRGKTIDDLTLSGSFSYINGNQTRTVEIIEKSPALAIINEDLYNKPVIDKEPDPEPEPVIIKKDDLTELTKEIKPLAHPLSAQDDEGWLLQPEQGVYYRVQLAAGRKPVNIHGYFTRLSVQENVKLEFHEGWRKYTVGSFTEYREARNHRVEVWDKTPINDAFVAAYNNGQRITVQEALMITNQKWFR